ncbi:MAG: DUF1499 domain-containing protein [Aggregatilineales bacterium]
MILLVALIILLVIARLSIAPLSPRPDNLGVSADGNLAPCPSSPNCYSSARNNRPIAYDVSQAEAHDRLVSIINSMERAEIITNQPDYIHAEYRSALWGFIDDVEFYFDPNNNVIHYRSAARLGYGDMNANRNRINAIIERFTN